MKKYLKIAIIAVAFGVGFFLGRKTIDVKEKVTFVKGETIHDTIVINEPTFVEIPAKPKYIYKYDTIVVDNIQYISEKVDTSAIIQDYILMRTYEYNVFNSPTLGKFDVKQKIGYNKLLSFDYTYTPMTKQITRNRERLITPFITGGYSTNSNILLGGGLYYKNVGIEYNMNISTKRNYRLNDFGSQQIIDILNDNRNYHTFKINYKL